MGSESAPTCVCALQYSSSTKLGLGARICEDTEAGALRARVPLSVNLLGLFLKLKDPTLRGTVTPLLH